MKDWGWLFLFSDSDSVLVSVLVVVGFENTLCRSRARVVFPLEEGPEMPIIRVLSWVVGWVGVSWGLAVGVIVFSRYVLSPLVLVLALALSMEVRLLFIIRFEGFKSFTS